MGRQDTPLKALRRFIAECGEKQTAAARLGIPPSTISQILSGERVFPRKVLDALGFERVIVERRRA